jgi:hypothetical protein
MPLFMVGFVLSLGVLGCVPVSEQPLTEPSAAEKDPRLMGDWYHRDGGESVHVHVGFQEKSGLLRLFMIDYDRDGDLDLSEWRGHISRLNGNRYLNLRQVQCEREEPGYIFVKYRIEGDRLCVSFPASRVWADAVSDGSVQGRLDRKKGYTSVHITEGRNGLQRFVREQDEKLFPEESCLQRLRLPRMSPASGTPGS